MARRFDISWSVIACCFVSISNICANKPDIHRNNHQTNVQTRTALDEYIQRPDPSYCYRVLTRTIPTTKRAKHIDHNWLQKIANTYVINMTSQTWLTGDDVDKSVWWHYMTVSIPEVIRREDTALLLIQGGENTDNPPNPLTDRIIHHFAKLANKLQMVVATVYQIPNGPIKFLDSTNSESSDEAIAHSWRLFIENKTDNADWLMQLPMTKAVVRAMDTVTSFANSKINRFYLSGASKRGWITWTTAAVDNRIVGIIPVVMDMLNLPSSIMHHYRSLGGWSFSLEPFWSQNLPSWILHPNFRRMVDIIDPLQYLTRLEIPKQLIIAGNDQTFLPDNSHYFYRNLLGTTLLRIVPNALHTQTGGEASKVLSSFILMMEEAWRLPKMTWTRAENATHGSILVETEMEPVRVGGWVALTLSGTRRDFRRLMAKEPGSSVQPVPQDVRFDNFEVNTLTPTTFEAVISIPAHRWACFFIELHFLAPDNEIMSTTTEVHIVPSTFPTKACNAEECISHLV